MSYCQGLKSILGDCFGLSSNLLHGGKFVLCDRILRIQKVVVLDGLHIRVRIDTADYGIHNISISRLPWFEFDGDLYFLFPVERCFLNDGGRD